MTGFINIRGNGADAITGERCTPDERVFDTGIKNRSTTYLRNHRTRVVKEATIVWLAEQAGYTLTKRDAGDSGDAKGVDGEDASVGGGEAPVGKVKAGGKSPAKRRSGGSTKG
jgi:hypothetical protein